jgi:uncharacterized protein
VDVEGGSGSKDGRCRVRHPRAALRRREAISLEELERWIDQLDPPPLIDGVSMLDGYLTAIIVGPCSIDPHEWLHHVLGPHSGLGMEGSKQAAAIMAIVARFNAVSEGLSAPIFERTDDGTVLAGPVVRGVPGRHEAPIRCLATAS